MAFKFLSHPLLEIHMQGIYLHSSKDLEFDGLHQQHTIVCQTLELSQKMGP